MWTHAPVFLSLVIEWPGPAGVGRNAEEDRILCASGPNTIACQSEQNRKLTPPHSLGQHGSQTFINISVQKNPQNKKIPNIQLSSILSSQILERKTIQLLPHTFFG